VQISYYDAASSQTQEQFSEVIEEAKRRYWPYPLVLLDGQIVMAGDVNTYAISRLVSQALAES
jgi:disulfide oxidoreductase YuzD